MGMGGNFVLGVPDGRFNKINPNYLIPRLCSINRKLARAAVKIQNWIQGRATQLPILSREIDYHRVLINSFIRLIKRSASKRASRTSAVVGRASRLY